MKKYYVKPTICIEPIEQEDYLLGSSQEPDNPEHIDIDPNVDTEGFYGGAKGNGSTWGFDDEEDDYDSIGHGY